jgi:hypothetical protein
MQPHPSLVTHYSYTNNCSSQAPKQNHTGQLRTYNQNEICFFRIHFPPRRLGDHPLPCIFALYGFGEPIPSIFHENCGFVSGCCDHIVGFTANQAR